MINEKVCGVLVDVTGGIPSEEELPRSIRWTRQADGSYAREGILPPEILTVRVFVVAEDHVECPGLRLRPKEEAIALVEQKISDGSYKAWRYEIRPEVPGTADSEAQTLPAPPQSIDPRLCANPRCTKGPDGSRAERKNQRAKYCSATCRVDVCRRKRKEANPDQIEKPRRKPRSDKRYESHAARQRAYDSRTRVTERLRRMDKWDLANYVAKMR